MKHANQVQLRDGRGEYTPTEQEWRDNQLRLLRDAMKGVIRDERVEALARGEVPTRTLQEEFERAAYAGLLDRGFNSEKDCDRIAALATIVKAAHEQRKLDAELRNERQESVNAKVIVVNSSDIARLSEMQRTAAKP